MIRNRLSDQFSIFVMRIRDPGPGEREAQCRDPHRACQRSPEKLFEPDPDSFRNAARIVVSSSGGAL